MPQDQRVLRIVNMSTEDAGIYACRFYRSASKGATSAEEKQPQRRLVFFMLDTIDNSSHERIRERFPDTRLLTAGFGDEAELAKRSMRPLLESKALNYEAYMQWSMWSPCSDCTYKEAEDILVKTTTPHSGTTKKGKNEKHKDHKNPQMPDTQTRWAVCRVRPKATRPIFVWDLFLLVHARFNRVDARCQSGVVGRKFWPGVPQLTPVWVTTQKCKQSCRMGRILNRTYIAPLLRDRENTELGAPFDDDLTVRATLLPPPFAMKEILEWDVRVEKTREDFVEFDNKTIVKKSDIDPRHVPAILRRDWHHYPLLAGRKGKLLITAPPGVLVRERRALVDRKLQLHCLPSARNVFALIKALPSDIVNEMRNVSINTKEAAAKLKVPTINRLERRKLQLEKLERGWHIELQWLRDLAPMGNSSNRSSGSSKIAAPIVNNNNSLVFEKFKDQNRGLYSCVVLLRSLNGTIKHTEVVAQYSVVGRSAFDMVAKTAHTLLGGYGFSVEVLQELYLRAMFFFTKTVATLQMFVWPALTHLVLGLLLPRAVFLYRRVRRIRRYPIGVEWID